MKGHKHSLNKYHQWADEVQVGKEAEQREERKWKKIFFIRGRNLNSVPKQLSLYYG